VVRDRGGGGWEAAILYRSEYRMFGFENMSDVVLGTFYRHIEARSS